MPSRSSRRPNCCCRNGTPRDVAVVRPWEADAKSEAAVRQTGAHRGRRLSTAHTASVATHLLSNGRYAVMLTAAGSGYSRWRDMAVTRWREDATCDDWGSYVFLRDVRSGDVWSAGYQPGGAEPDAYDVAFNEDRAEITRHDGTSDDDAGSACLGRRRRRGPPCLDHQSGNRAARDRRHLLCRTRAGAAGRRRCASGLLETVRRNRIPRRPGRPSGDPAATSPAEPEIWAAHLAIVDGEAVGKPEFETDRARFLGRGHGIRSPIAVIDGRPLSNTVGTVLDPIFALRRRVRIAPGTTVRIAFWTMVAASREAVLDLVDKHRDTTAFERATTLAWTQAQVQLHHLGIDAGEADLFQRLAGHLLYAEPALRPSSETILRGAGATAGTVAAWAFPATCRSCCCASPTSRISTSPANCCRRTNTGG